MAEGGGKDPPDRSSDDVAGASAPLFESYKYDEATKYLAFKVVISNERDNASAFDVNDVLAGDMNRGDIVFEQFGKRVIAHCANGAIANSLTSNEKLEAAGYSAYIPLYYVATAAIVWNVDVRRTEEWVLNNIRTPEGRKVLKVFRMKKRIFKKDGSSQLIPANRVKIFIEGCGAPQFVYFKDTRCQASLFVKRFTQCGNCFKFNHIAKFCERERICKGCGRKAHDGYCEFRKCAGCGADSHPTTSPNCSAKIRQRNINQAMATEMLSWDEASRKFPAIKRNDVTPTYAGVLSTNPFEALAIEDPEYPALPTQQKSNNQQKKQLHIPSSKRKNTQPDPTHPKMTMKAAKRAKADAQSQIVDATMQGIEEESSSAPGFSTEERNQLLQELAELRERLRNNQPIVTGVMTTTQAHQEEFFQNNLQAMNQHTHPHPPMGGSNRAADGDPF